MDRLLKKNIKIQYNFAGVRIWFDPNHIRQILTNLITNSIEASTQAGIIEIIQQEENGKFLLKVKDEGSGISDEDIEKIFNPFFTTKKNGAGLGLAICKKLCQENKAEIWMENHSIRGCTFFIRGKLSE